MALSLVGLDPVARRSYSWIGDDACDVGASAVAEFFADGTGLVGKHGHEMTVLVCEPLRPTVAAMVWGAAHFDAGNMAAVYRAAVAYSVVEIQNGPAMRRVTGPGGFLRLHDDLLAMLDAARPVKVGDTTWSLMSHLGGLILRDSEATDIEKKALVLPSTPERSSAPQPKSSETGSSDASSATPTEPSGTAEGAAQGQ